MRLKERLRGIVAAVATAALALSVVPTAAAAVTLQNGTAVVEGVTGATNVALYKVASVSDADDNNQLEVTFQYGSYQLADWEQDPAGVANAIDDMIPADTQTPYSQSLDGQTDSATFSNVEPGLYLVRVTPRDAGVVYQTTIMKVMPVENDATGEWDAAYGKITLKKGEDNINTSLTKQVSADGETGWDESIDTLSAGETAYFRVQVAIPQYRGISASDDVTFTLVDTLPEGLTYVPGSAEATAGSTEVSGDAKTITVTLNAQDLINAATEGDETLTLTLSATVDAGQLGPLTNSAVARWYQHVNDDDPITTKPDTASVVVYGASVTKRVGYLNSNNQVATDSGQETLNGAEFVLERYNRDTRTWDIVLDSTEANPTLTVASLSEGMYRWRETKAPAGYQLNDTTTMTFSVNHATATEANNYTVGRQFGDLRDDSIVQLPQTGGPGTIALTVAGVGLIAGAAVWAVRSRKEN